MSGAVVVQSLNEHSTLCGRIQYGCQTAILAYADAISSYNTRSWCISIGAAIFEIEVAWTTNLILGYLNKDSCQAAILDVIRTILTCIILMMVPNLGVYVFGACISEIHVAKNVHVRTDRQTD